ncbi:MAG: DUF3854 domain-containing protein [Lachnospiraceae bacterium]|nr:DUF3854 domain-containing protein [Lachnospiraceae bacterium]
MDTRNGILKEYLTRKGFPTYTCPFCGKGKSRGDGVSIKDTDSLFKCFHCGFGGNLTTVATEIYFGDSLIQDEGELQKAYDFYEKPVSKTGYAMKAVEIFLGMEDRNVPRNYKFSNTEDERNPETDIERRNKIYLAMTRIMPLEENAKRSLLERGYTAEQIKKQKYVSLPKSFTERKKYTKMLQKITGDDLKGVAGFSMYKGEMIMTDGGFYKRCMELGIPKEEMNNYYLFLCPSFDLHGRLQYFQIAFDKKVSGKNIECKNADGSFEKRNLAKYTVFSTPWQECGGRVKVNAGWCGPYKQNEDGAIVPDTKGRNNIPIIEGVLKTNLYVNLTNLYEPAISQVGVANTNQLHDFFKELKSLCPEIVCIDECYDMDKLENESVAKAVKKLETIVKEEGFKYQTRQWNPKYKGADDLALAHVKGAKDTQYKIIAP